MRPLLLSIAILLTVLFSVSALDAGDHPVPVALELEEAEKRVKEAFEAQYAKRKPNDRVELAKNLLETAMETRGDLPTRYVLLRESSDVAARSGAFRLTMSTIDELERTFDVDPLAVRLDALTKLTRSAKIPLAHAYVAGAAMELFDRALRKIDFDTAKKAHSLATKSGRKSKDAWIQENLGRRSSTLLWVKKTSRKLEAAATKLAEDSEDGEANRRIGEFLCFLVGDWDEGLAHLEQSDDEKLAKIASVDASRPPNTDRQVALGLAWAKWAKARRSSEAAIRDAAYARARRWLLEAKKEASGLAAKEVENTLLEIPEIPLIELEPKRVVIDTKALNKRSGRLYRLRSRQSLMAHPPAKGKAKVAYLIGGGFARFEAVVAFSDSAKKPRSHLVFEVWGDNKRLWRSKKIRKHMSQSCDIDIRGVRFLELYTFCPGWSDYAHGTWFDPVIKR